MILPSASPMSAARRSRESNGEMQRAIENIETACGMPMLMQGHNCEDIAPGIDEHMIRQPLGVVAAITPFNFPGMIPFWFLPYAVAAGNCFLLKPSERVPITSQKLFHLIQAAGFPSGVVQLVNGGSDVVNAILDHPGHPRRQLRRLHRDGALHLQPRRGQRQARPVPGRGQESRRRSCPTPTWR